MSVALKSIKLLDALGGEVPAAEEGIWNFIVRGDLNTCFGVVQLNPVEWYTKEFNVDETPKKVFENYAEPWQKKLVAQYRKKVAALASERYIIVEGDLLLDGWHRMTAFALEGVKSVRALDLCLVE